MRCFLFGGAILILHILDYSDCGRSSPQFGRVVGGIDSPNNAWPWQVLIARSSSSLRESLARKKTLGGGSILNQKWVLSAAHVFKDSKTESNWPRNIVLFAGMTKRPSSRQTVGDSIVAYLIGKYHEHEEYIDGRYINDIALIEVGYKLDDNLSPIYTESAGFTYGESIKPVYLPSNGTSSTEPLHSYDQSLFLEGTKVTVTGFGHTRVILGGQQTEIIASRTLQEASLRIASDITCREHIEQINRETNSALEFAESMLCTEPAERDACTGDSGGPLLRKVTDENTKETRWVQVGIVSFGYGCASNHPGYYTKVASFIPWINQKIKDDHCIDSPCRNGGTCFNRKEDYTCFCTKFFEGRSCQSDLRCQEPLERIHHGSRTSFSGNLLPGNGTAVYKCDARYVFANGLSTKKIDCIQRSRHRKGHWSSSWSSLRCEEITCRLPASDQNRRLLNPKAKWLVGDTAEYQCKSGYIALDESGRSPIRWDAVCLSSQQWSNEPPQCIRHSQSLCDGSYRFRCRNGACISRAKRCNGFQDCEGGEDELDCDRIQTCKPRNLVSARRNNYTCRSPCNRSRWLTGCRGPKKRCVCDDECGWSCINPDSQCEADPPEVPNATVEVRKMNPEEKQLRPRDFGPPYDFQDVAVYTCYNGTKLDGPFPRCSGRKTWSNEIPICKDIVCHERPPVVPGASSHSFARPIRGGGKRIFAHTRSPEIGDTVEYECEQGLLLEGNPPICGSDLRWTEYTSRCVVECFEDRDPALIRRYDLHCGQQCNLSFDCLDGMECHCDRFCARVCVNPDVICNDAPDIPHTMLNYYGYGIRKIARYQCQAGYYRTSGLFTLRCSGSGNWIGERLSCQRQINRRRFIGIDSSDTARAHEIYFMFDVSDSVMRNNKKDLKIEITFAKRLVERMKRFGGKISYGIMVFAVRTETVLDITDGQTPSPRIIEELDNVYRRAASKNFRRVRTSGTDMGYALDRVTRQVANMRANQVEDTARHIFLFTDGRHTEGSDPVKTRKDIEAQFYDVHSTIEFYSITACRRCNDVNYQELKGLSTGENGENYIYIEDFYQMDSYLDRVTDVAIDYSECGQAGKIGPTINQQAQLGRSIGGENAKEDAWPWQALFVRRGNTIEQSLEKVFLQGGGSILNEHWILTAAHLFKSISVGVNWKQKIAVFVGIFERSVLGPAEAYAIAEHFSHPNYVDETTSGYDIALIKLGVRLDGTMNEALDAERDGLTFTYYIRPVCLPCTGTCLKKKHLVNGRNEPLVSDDMRFDEKCNVEENLLHANDAKAVVTGYGHLNYSEINKLSSRVFNPPRKLQQALLKILPDEKCQTEVEEMNDQIEYDYVYDGDDGGAGPTPVEYSNTMLCCKSGIKDKTVAPCKGDGGGPLVRGVRDFETQKSCWVQIGISSWGYGCGLEFPSYFTKVTKFIRWINETIGGTLPSI